MRMDARALVFFRLCERLTSGTLRITDPQGRAHVFGDGAEPSGEIHIRDWRVVTAALARGDIGFGEAYVEGYWDSPDLEALTSVLLANDTALNQVAAASFWSRLGFLVANRLARRNSKAGSRRNIAAHYDVGNDFYSLWLDETMTYSSAIFADESEPLPVAQNRKYDRLLTEAPGERLLEIGCGWGGLADRAAEQGRDVTAVTISREQHEHAQNRLGGRADIRLQDYRDIRGRFDAIVSIEMVEAVGERYWPNYFSALKNRLADGGRAALQAIVVEDEAFERYRTRSDYIRHYTFPGGMLLSPGAIREQAEKAGLVAEEFFRFGPDYARTLRLWLQRFEANASRIQALGYSDAFMRSWRYYMSICAAAFAGERRTNVVQVALRHA